MIIQLLLVVRAYWADHDVFGFQMFPESSEWQATIIRVEADGDRHDVRDPWPGDYRWQELVRGRGLDAPFGRSHADTGLPSTLGFFEAALEWVAANTPQDGETLYLEAVVTTWDNGRGPRQVVLRTPDRAEALR